jgi:hypothetical protein
MVVRSTVCGDPVVLEIFSHIVDMEIILAWLWLVGFVAFLVLVGYLLRGRRNKQSSRGSYYLEARLLPKRMELFRQRRRPRHPTFGRWADRSKPLIQGGGIYRRERLFPNETHSPRR